MVTAPPELLCYAQTCERKIRSRSARAEGMSFDSLRQVCLSRAAKQSSTSGLIGFTAEVKPAPDFGKRSWRHRLSLHGPAHAESSAQRASRLLSMNTAIKTVTP